MGSMVFKYPRGQQVSALIGLVMFLALALFLFWTSGEIILFLAVILGLGMVAMLWQTLRGMVVYTVDASGISKRWPWGMESSINWMNVMQARPNLFTYGLTLSDQIGIEKVSLDPQVADYLDMLDFIRQRRPGIWQEHERDVFNLMNVPAMIVTSLAAGAALIFVVFVIGDLDWFFLLFLGFFLLIPFLTVAVQPLQMWVDGLELKIRYLRGVQAIQVSDIQRIEMRIEQRSRGRKSVSLVISLKDGKTVRLPGNHRRASLAYNVLCSWLERYSAS